MWLQPECACFVTVAHYSVYEERVYLFSKSILHGLLFYTDVYLKNCPVKITVFYYSPLRDVPCMMAPQQELRRDVCYYFLPLIQIFGDLFIFDGTEYAVCYMLMFENVDKVSASNLQQDKKCI